MKKKPFYFKKYLIKKDFEEINSNSLNSTIRNINRIDNNKIEYISNVKENDNNINLTRKIFKILKKFSISIIAVIIIILLMINFKYCFLNVKIISSDNTIDEKLLPFFTKYYYSLGPFKYLNKDIDNINTDLKSNFYEYEWINAKKDGINIKIEVKNKDDLKEKVDNSIVGDIIASKDGIINSLYIQNGIVLKHVNEYVKKDDILISGNLLYNKGKVQYTKAIGSVLAITFAERYIEVLKTDKKIIRSGRIQTIRKPKFLIKDIKTDFINYETEIIEGKYFFSMTTIYVYELIEVINNNTYSEAIETAKSIIYNDFNINKTHNNEKILQAIILKENHDNQYYRFTYLIKALENIALFKELKVE